MKKIVAIILVLCALLALASCGKKTDNNADLDTVKAAVAATSLKNAHVEVVATNSFIAEPLTAKYDIVYDTDGSAEIEFTYELYNEISENGTQDVKTEYSGSATVASNGEVVGDPVSGTVTAAGSANFNLDPSKMTYSFEMGIFTANIPAANTAAVLGISVGADVVLTVSVANGVVTGATVTYTKDNVKNEIVCTYNN